MGRRQIYTNPSARSWSSPWDATTPHAQPFHQTLPGYTPSELFSLDELAVELGVKRIRIKAETGRLGLPSFKVLGASYAIARHFGVNSLSDLIDAVSGRSITLYAATEGNHGRAVARVASLMGSSVKAKIFVRNSMDEHVRELISSEPSTEVVLVDGGYDDAVHLSAKEATEQVGSTEERILVMDTSWQGYEDVPQHIVEGYRTMLEEIDQTLGEEPSTHVIIPVGVGSLAQAVVSHYKSSGIPPTAVISVEPDTAAPLHKSLVSGKVTNIALQGTIMNGLNCGTLSKIAWPVLQNGIDASVTVSDFEAHEAVEYLNSRGIAAGPCGGASLAALRYISRVKPKELGLSANSVVTLICSEGYRPYQLPSDVSMSDAVSLTQALVRIDSSNPALSRGAGETVIANFIAAWLEHRDFEVHKLQKTPGRPTIVGVARGTGGGRSIMFNGHVDTVTLAGYKGDPLSGEIRDGKLYGRGSNDMKSGLAAALVAAVEAKNAKVRGDVIVAAVADEESGSLGTEELLEAGWTADGAIISEPTSQDVSLAHKGFIWLEVDVLGKAGHGSNPSTGIDAIVKAGYFLVELEKYGSRLLSGDTVHPALGTGTVHASLIKGGEEPSSYPAECTITVERRTIPSETQSLVVSQFTDILENLKRSIPDFDYRIRVTFQRQPLEVQPDNPFIISALNSIETVIGHQPVMKGGSYWTDCALLSEKGIPCFLFGPGGGGLHAETEWAETASIEEVTRSLTQVVLDFCN